MSLMMCLYMLGGDMLLYFLCSCFTNYDILIMIYIMRLFKVYVFYFMFCEKKAIYFGLIVFSTHAFMVYLMFLEFTG